MSRVTLLTFERDRSDAPQPMNDLEHQNVINIDVKIDIMICSVQ